MNEVVTFPTPEGAKLGFYELDDIALKFEMSSNKHWILIEL